MTLSEWVAWVQAMDWAEWVQAVSAAFTGAVAWVAWRTANEAKRAAQADVLGRLMADYATHEMSSAIELIGRHEDIIARTGIGHTPLDHVVGETSRELRDLSAAGRSLHLFVRQAAILLFNDAISPSLFRDAIAQSRGYRLWGEVWIPYMRVKPAVSEDTGSLDWADRLLAEHPPGSPGSLR